MVIQATVRHISLFTFCLNTINEIHRKCFVVFYHNARNYSSSFKINIQYQKQGNFAMVSLFWTTYLKYCLYPMSLTFTRDVCSVHALFIPMHHNIPRVVLCLQELHLAQHKTILSLFIEQSSTVHLHHNIVSCYVCIRFVCCETVTCDYIFATTKCGSNETNKNWKKDTMQ